MKNYGEIALKGHRLCRGKISTGFKVPVRSLDDLSIWYTPGVAAPSLAIAKDNGLVFEYTNKGNSIAVVSDGSRLLGLGNIGPEAALPVMEGKSLLFKYLGDVDAVPICLGTQDPHEFVKAVEWIAPTYGGINLEDISQPKCFWIYQELASRLEIPVFHDDQQGSAVVALAGLINALKVVNKDLRSVKLTLLGTGAAGRSTFKLLVAAGADPKRIVLVDSKGILSLDRKNLDSEKRELAAMTNSEGRVGGLEVALKDADGVIAFSTPGPGVITREMVHSMAENPVVFALANPVPEILPEEAKKGGAAVVATGRSDYPNQVNNSLGFPAIFRGMLDVHARGINIQMMLAAAKAIASFAEEKGLSRGYIIPTMEEDDVFPREAVAVARAAMETGMARIKVDLDELLEATRERLRKVRRMMKVAIAEGFIPNL
ncbi:MAG: NADP-dependent malic enzyme, partial [Candidatus Bathyarchaeia archaeon]